MMRKLDIDRIETHPLEGSRNKSHLLPHGPESLGDALGKYSEVADRPVQLDPGQCPEHRVKDARAMPLYNPVSFLAPRASDQIIALDSLGIEQRNVLWSILQVAIHDHIPSRSHDVDTCRQ